MTLAISCSEEGVTGGQEGSTARNGISGKAVDWEGITHELLKALHGFGRYRHKKMPNMEFHGELGVLHTLYHGTKPLAPSELATKCHVTTARMAKTLNQLESQGLIIRETDASDRRRVMVSLTVAGKQEIQRRFTQMSSYLTGILKDLGEDDSYELIRIIKRLAAILSTREQSAARCQHACGTLKMDVAEAETHR